MPTNPARFLQRLSGARHWPKYLFALACCATLVALVLTVANRRELRAQPGPANGMPAVAERAAAAKLEPPPVPSGQNFAATPYFQSLFDKSINLGASQWPDDFSRADQWPRRVPTLAESAEGRKTGRLLTDLVAWKKSFDYAFDLDRSSDSREEIVVSDPPEPVANARAALAVLENLRPYEAALAELHAVRTRPHSRFDVKYNWENPWGILLPHLAIVKRTCQLLRLKASAELAAGQSEQALQDVLLMVRLVESLKGEPTLISQLVRVACLEITFQPIWEGLGQRRWSDVQLQSLQGALQQIDLLASLQHCLEAERTWADLTIALIRDRRTPNFFSSILDENMKKEEWVKEADEAFLTCPRDWFDAERENYRRLCEGWILKGYDVAAKRVHPLAVEENSHLLHQALRNKNTLLRDHLVFAKALLIAPSKIHLKLAGTQGYADLAVVACALERHRLAVGRFPESLAALTPRFVAKVPHDIVSGQPLRYQRTDDGQFVLYSVGWNESDEHGELAFLASGRGPEKKEGDWVWRHPAPAVKVSFE